MTLSAGDVGAGFPRISKDTASGVSSVMASLSYPENMVAREKSATMS